MSKAQPTPRPWRQGRTLLTAQTRTWNGKQWRENETFEGLQVFANFRDEDQGRGRILVCRCERVEDARYIAQLPNIVSRLKEALKAARDHLEYCGYGDRWERECAYDRGLPDLINQAIEQAEKEVGL